VGRSSRDNLALLRKARAWDFWLHLKDVPSAHAILQREKNQHLKDQDLNKAGKWLVEQSFRLKKEKYQGQRFEVVFAECRYVRPIKGDKVGRVTYQKGGSFSVQMPASS
jgi:predicted ribosome quality control (RQC) complex YloA/Tae2 family protein